MFHQLLLAKTSIHELLDEFVATKLEQLHVRFHATIERHGDPPRPLKNLGIFDRHFVPNGVRRHQREALGQMQSVAMEIPGAVEPAPVIEIRDVDDESISVPSSHGVTHPGIVRRPCDFVQMDGARGIREFVGNMNLVRTLRDLKRIRHVHRTRNARQVTLQLRVAVNPVLSILLLDQQGFWLVGDLSVALHDAERSGYRARGTEREDRRCRHPRVVIRINARLCDGGGKRRMRLQIPVRFVIGLPDAAEVRLAAHAGRPRGRSLTQRSRDGHRKDGADRRRSNGDRYHGT